MVNPDDIDDEELDENKSVSSEVDDLDDADNHDAEEHESDENDEEDVPDHKKDEASHADEDEIDSKKEERRNRRQEAKVRRKNAELRNKLRIEALERDREMLVREIEGLKRSGASQELSQIDRELEEAKMVVDQAERMIAEAFAENDGEKYLKAQRARDHAREKNNRLVSIKQNYVDSRAHKATEPQLNQVTKSLATRWIEKNKSWFNVDRDATQIAEAIDRQVLADGYRHDTPAYWDELDRRVAKVMPEHYQRNKATSESNGVAKKRPPQLVGGSGRESVAVAATSTGYRDVPKEYIDNLKMAGKWDDEPTRKKMIQRYRDQVKSTQASA